MNSYWKLLWASLLSFLTLREGEGGDDPDPADAGNAGGEGEGDEGGDDDGEDSPAESADGLSFDELLAATEDAMPAGKGKDKQAKPDAHALEVQLAEERGRRMALESRPAPAAAPAPQPMRDHEAEAEDAQYRAAVAAGTEEKDLRLLAWTIQSNRALRNQQRETSRIALETKDASDRAEFGRLEITAPKAYKRYADEVERMVAVARQNGQAVPRKMVMQTLIGRDFLDGKIKPKTLRARSAEGERQPARVDRGRMPGTRTNIGRNESGKPTPGQAAAKRLRNVHI